MQYILILVAVLLMLFDITLGQNEEEQEILESPEPRMTTEMFAINATVGASHAENRTEIFTVKSDVNITLKLFTTEITPTQLNITTKESKINSTHMFLKGKCKKKSKCFVKGFPAFYAKTKTKLCDKRNNFFISPDYWEDLQLKSVALKLKQNPKLYKKFLDWSTLQPKHSDEGDMELNEIHFLQPTKNTRHGKKKAIFSIRHRKDKDKDSRDMSMKKLDSLFTKITGNQNLKETLPLFTSIDYNDFLMMPEEDDPALKTNSYDDQEQIGENNTEEREEEEESPKDEQTNTNTDSFNDQVGIHVLNMDQCYQDRDTGHSYSYVPLYCILKTNINTRKSILYCFAKRRKLKSYKDSQSSTSLSGGQISCPCCNNMIDITICARGPDDFNNYQKGTTFNKYQYRHPLFRIDMPENCIKDSRLNEMKNSRNYQTDFSL